MSEIEGKAAREAASECGQRASFNGAFEESDIEGKAAVGSGENGAARDACDIDGQTGRSNGAFGKSDIEGKVARVAARKRGRDRVSNGWEHLSQSWEANEFQSRG
jgi:hypothetical protein